MTTTYLNDNEFYAEIVESVKEESEKSFAVKLFSGWHLSIQKGQGASVPRAGGILRIFGRPFSYTRGVALIEGVSKEFQDAIDGYLRAKGKGDKTLMEMHLNLANSFKDDEDEGVVSQVFYYMSPAEHEAKLEAEEAVREAEKVLAWREGEAESRRRIAALSLPFQERFALFEKHCGEEWMIEHLPYELFTCEQAVLMAEQIDDLQAFHALSWEEQKEAFPDLDEGHSGNTFGAAVSMANVIKTQPQMIPYAHAAIHTLVGCKDAGCFAGRKDRTGETLPEAPSAGMST